MIDPELFGAEFTLLEERFARASSEPILHRYYAYISARLTDEQFQQASITIFNEDTFFPTPKRFIDAVHGTLEDQAAVEWSNLLEAHQNNTRADVSAIARKVWSEIYAAGQLNSDSGDQRVSFVRRDFIQTYRAHQTIDERPPGMLPAPTAAEKNNMLETQTRVQAELKHRQLESTP